MPIQLAALPPREAIAALEARGHRLPRTFAWQDMYADEHARAFTVAKSAGFDILNDIYEGLSKALEEGSTERDFQKLVTPILQAKGWWGRQRVVNPATGLPETAQLGSTRRLRTIFNVNMRVSYAAGHWASFERNKALRPILRYVHLDPQEHPRPLHQSWHNICLPIEHPWWKTHACPNGWECKCTQQSLSRRDVDRLIAEGVPLKFDAPDNGATAWTNKVTGEVREIPNGIDPGWDYNPGEAGWRARVNAALAAKISVAPFELARAGVEDRVRSPEFQRFLDKPEGDMPVMTIGGDVADAIGSSSRVALLSAETMRKQLSRHSELGTEEYLGLRAIGDAPTLVVQDGARSVVVLKRTLAGWRHVAMKTTSTGKANFVSSFRITSDADIEKLLARPGVRVLLDRR